MSIFNFEMLLGRIRQSETYEPVFDKPARIAQAGAMAELPALSLKNLQAVILDWAGTTVDYGCRGPARVFVESFAAHGLEVTEAEAREPMGMNKLDHVAGMRARPRIGQRWRTRDGAPRGGAGGEVV